MEQDTARTSASDERLERMFDMLWSALEDAKVALHVGPVATWLPGEAGWFRPKHKDRTGWNRIELYRDHAAVRGDRVAELLTLAHEAGHLLSYVGGFRGARYDEVQDKRDGGGRLDPDERAVYLGEEERAWTFARSLLTELGFDGWAAFDAASEFSMREHAKRLDAVKG